MHPGARRERQPETNCKNGYEIKKNTTLTTAHSRAKSAILRSKGRTSALWEPPSAQKPNFCARKAGKVPSEGPKRAKTSLLRSRRSNNGYWEDLPRTKSLFLSLKSIKTWKKLPKKGQNGHFCPQNPLSNC